MPTRPLTAQQLVEAVRLYREHDGNASAAGRSIDLSQKAFCNRLKHAEARGLMSAPAATVEPKQYRTHCVIPDCQVRDGVPLDHLEWAGKYIAEKKPDVLICIGDFADMQSLSRYNSKLKAENLRYKKDRDAVRRGMKLLMTPIVMEPDYDPIKIMIPGNHEAMIDRYVNDNPILEGTISADDLGYKEWGWDVKEYLKPFKIDGVSYCHYFYNHNTGKPYAGANLQTRLNTIGFSFTMGHQQGLSIAIRDLGDGEGTRQRGLVAGSFYQHAEEYKGPQGNGHWHGIIFKHEVQDGNYDLCEISLDYLKRRYKTCAN